jgi:cell pole-organizing protein PopZ
MSTNGASEPSMEEILASIRNIIAQDPADSETDGGEQPANAEPELARSLSPFGSALADFGPEPALPRPTQPLGERLVQSERQKDPAQPAAAQRASVQGAPQGPEPGAKSAVSATAPGGTPIAQGAAPAAAKASPADDFSDVFEEPLKQAPAGASALPKAGPSAQPAKDQTVSTSSHAGVRAEQASSPALKEAQSASEAGGGESKALNAKPGPGFAAAPAEGRGGKPTAGGFDFAKLRARAPLAAADGLQRFASDTEPETEPLPLARSDVPSKRDSQQASGSGANADSAQPVVIAAMPQQDAKEGPSAPAAGLGAGDAKEPVVEPVQSASANEPGKTESGLKSSNVGFLAASPRPLGPNSAQQSDGGDFFKAVAGEAAGGEEPAKVEPNAEEGASLAAKTGETETKSQEEAELPASEAAAATPIPSAQQVELVEAAVAPDTPPNTEVPSTDGLSVAGILVSNESGGVRTLEDTVADLLRPLLREWLENNMPRIVENALRLEVAESVKKQLEQTVRGPNGLSS